MEVQPTGNMISNTDFAQKSVTGTELPVRAKPVASSVEVATAVQQPAPVPSLDQLGQAVKQINQALQQQSQNLEFSIDADSNHTIVKVIDQKTKEVLRQIPSVETLEIAKALDQATGLLIKQKV
jgi:flagellar protein FlaG